MSRRLRPLACTAGLLAALALAACGKGGSSAPSGQTIAFSIVPAEQQALMESYWRPLIDDMKQQTGLNIELHSVPNYNAMIEAMRFNQTQVGWFPAESEVEAVNRANAEVFARTLDEQGSDSYNSVILSRKGSGVDLARLVKCDKTLTFGMGDPVSTSGTLAPIYFLFMPRHIDPNACFKAVRSANHQANMLGVANGVLDAATNNSTGLLYYRTGSPASREAVAKTQVIWTSPPIPEAGFVYRKDLPEDVKAKLRAFITGYGKAPGAEGERQRAILKHLKYGGFEAADDSYLAPILKMQAAIRGAAKPAG